MSLASSADLPTGIERDRWPWSLNVEAGVTDGVIYSADSEFISISMGWQAARSKTRCCAVPPSVLQAVSNLTTAVWQKPDFT